jgi:hypothetical protein
LTAARSANTAGIIELPSRARPIASEMLCGFYSGLFPFMPMVLNGSRPPRESGADWRLFQPDRDPAGIKSKRTYMRRTRGAAAHRRIWRRDQGRASRNRKLGSTPSSR